MLKGDVTHPSQARLRSWIQVTRAAGGSWELKIIWVGTKIPRGGGRERVIKRLPELFLDIARTEQARYYEQRALLKTNRNKYPSWI
jgi:hypothetical protein